MYWNRVSGCAWTCCFQYAAQSQMFIDEQTQIQFHIIFVMFWPSNKMPLGSHFDGCWNPCFKHLLKATEVAHRSHVRNHFSSRPCQECYDEGWAPFSWHSLQAGAMVHANQLALCTLALDQQGVGAVELFWDCQPVPQYFSCLGYANHVLKLLSKRDLGQDRMPSMNSREPSRVPVGLDTSSFKLVWKIYTTAGAAIASCGDRNPQIKKIEAIMKQLCVYIL